MAVSLNTAIKPKADANSGQDPDTRRMIEATAETYDTAYAALVTQVPTGWVIVGIKRW